MKELNTQAVALIFGLFMAGFHLLWALLIMLGAAQAFLDWAFWLHMIKNPYMVMPFSFTTALWLLIVTFLVGYVGGWFFALIWNKVHKK
jgi:hypothetical protein